MSSHRRRPKPTRDSSLLSFYNWGAPPSDGYKDSARGSSVASLGTSRVSTPRESREATPTRAGPSRTPRRRASQRLEDRILSSSHPSPRSLVTFSPKPIVTTKPAKNLYVDTTAVQAPQQVRFNASPEMIEPSPESEYGLLPGVDDEIWKAFQAADTDNSGTIDPRELRTALVNSPWNRPFEHATIDMLIKIFDINKNKAIEFQEFRGLSKYVKQWRGEFEKADRDGSGSIDIKELKKALARYGYHLRLRVVKLLHQKYARRSRGHIAEEEITFDQFIRACVSVSDLAKTFEQVNGPVNEQNKANFEAFVLAAVSN